MNSFTQLGLSPALLSTLDELGFTQPTDIQAQAIPQLLEAENDFIGLAQTGTGKTAAFGLPLLEKVNPNNPVTQALILSPTRELGQQIAEQIKIFAKKVKGLRIEVVYGGASIINQIRALKPAPHIVIATPGRLIDLVNRKALKLDSIEYLVLDEADEMLNMGFRDELDTILEFTPDEKVTWLFSATMPADIRRLTKKYMSNPSEVSIAHNTKVNENIVHQYTLVRASDKTEALCRFIDFNPDLYGLVFCRTRSDTQRVATELIERGYMAEALHGDLSQQQRDRVMKHFKSKYMKLLVATDVAARGIDVNELTHVFHYNLPDDTEYYTHRSGRTARAGLKGISLALITNSDRRKIKFLEHKLNISFQKEKVPTAQQVIGNKVQEWANGIIETEDCSIVNPDLQARAEASLAHLSHSELIERLLALELKKIGNTNTDRDLNDTSKPVRERGERGERGRGGNSQFSQFFINVGSIDDIRKGELLRFLCDTTGLSKSQIGNITLLKRHAYFEIERNNAIGIEAKFRKTVVNGRNIRVNKENNSHPQHKKSFERRPRRDFRSK